MNSNEIFHLEYFTFPKKGKAQCSIQIRLRWISRRKRLRMISSLHVCFPYDAEDIWQFLVSRVWNSSLFSPNHVTQGISFWPCIAQFWCYTLIFWKQIIFHLSFHLYLYHSLGGSSSSIVYAIKTVQLLSTHTCMRHFAGKNFENWSAIQEKCRERACVLKRETENKYVT